MQHQLGSLLFRTLCSFALNPEIPPHKAGKNYAAMPELHWRWWIDIHWELRCLRTCSKMWSRTIDYTLVLTSIKMRNVTVVCNMPLHKSPFWGRFKISGDASNRTAVVDLKNAVPSVQPNFRVHHAKRRRLSKAEKAESEFLQEHFRNKKKELDAFADGLGVSTKGLSFIALCNKVGIELARLDSLDSD